ncbi:ATP-dependent helicase [Haloquadratum walsbyi]|uniref:Lhr-like helicase n=1 Tax=Haloquadratum walsbyi J07HQW2 TaxID=1238425 RepID=U1NDQ7_9EURY|nr:ATP-dependent helicase [Haloquadratum walsbyi]ERG95135.1 MAG: Lhr-like helicase [Haloquadratum walsbyi J07HQW2]
MSQRGRTLLREAAERARINENKSSFTFDPTTVEINDADVLDQLDPAVQEWWVSQFGRYVDENDGFFTPPQREAIPLVDQKENALVCAPTGSGKTLASFTAVLNDLFKRARRRDEGLENQVYCLYISPLKSLANDIHRNLAVPLSGIRERIIATGANDTTDFDSDRTDQPTTAAAADGSTDDEDAGTNINVRHAIRHGDTDSAERQRMLEETPHILNTTPETLAILLNAPKFREKLRSIEYVIVDEIHSLAANKRGTHLSVSLERLEALTETSPTRIGCSATVEPLSTVGEFLVGYNDNGTPREYELVDTRFVREFDISVECPTDDLIYTPRGEVQARFYDRLEQLIDDHKNTIVFTNTRSGAERVLSTLRNRSGTFDESNSGCHHGSLSKTRRQEIESELKAGTLDVVTTSTSLELGIDMPHVDLVVQVGSPKSVAALLQRVGRAGHQLGETVEGRVIALDRDELVECAVMLQKAESGFVDRVFIPEGAHDVAAQHIYGMAINAIRREATFQEILTRAYPYREYNNNDWEELLRYLTADYDGLDEKNVYPKIWRDTNDAPSGEHHHEEFPVGAPLIGKRGRLARVIYMTNIGTIPDSFSCTVLTRGEDKQVGTLDEDYLDTLEKGDVFVLGGDRFEYRYRRGSKVYVDRTSERPTVPSWFSERLPLSYDLGREIAAFQGELINRLEADGAAATRQWLNTFPVDTNSAQAITRIYDQQRQYTGATSVSTDNRLVVEEELDKDSYRRRFYIHSTYGRRFNDGLSRLLAYHCAQQTNANVKIAVADNGFTLVMPLNRKVDVGAVLESIEPSEARSDLRSALDGTDLLKRYFRINATRSLMILKRYKGYEKSAAQQQVSSEMLLSFAEELDSFAVIDETYREILEDKLNVDAIEGALRNIQANELIVETVQVDSPSPRAFGLATLAASDVVLAEDESAVLQDFHARVQAEIGDEETASETETQTSSS